MEFKNMLNEEVKCESLVIVKITSVVKAADACSSPSDCSVTFHTYT